MGQKKWANWSLAFATPPKIKNTRMYYKSGALCGSGRRSQSVRSPKNSFKSWSRSSKQKSSSSKLVLNISCPNSDSETGSDIVTIGGRVCSDAVAAAAEAMASMWMTECWLETRCHQMHQW